jgi:DNA repair protein RadC
MTINTLFGEEVTSTSKTKPIKFKVIKSVYETLTVRDEISVYFGKDRYTDPQQIHDAFKWLLNETKEYFISLHLDGKNRIVCIDMISIGSLNQSIVHPRETFKTALLSNAAAIILVHNHPTGDPTPSREDLSITRRLREAGEILGIKVLDHIIIGETYCSFVTRGIDEEVIVTATDGVKEDDLSEVWEKNQIGILMHKIAQEAGIFGKCYLRFRGGITDAETKQPIPVKITIVDPASIYEIINPLSDEVEGVICRSL